MSQLKPEELHHPDPKIKYGPIWNHKNDKDEDIICDVCLDDSVEEGDDMCNIAVH